MLRPTIRNKLVGGFGALLLLMAVVAVIGRLAEPEIPVPGENTDGVGRLIDFFDGIVAGVDKVNRPIRVH